MAQYYLFQLGPFQFSATGHNVQKMDRTLALRWDPQNRIGRRPAHQFMGPGNEDIEFQGVIYPHFFGGLAQYENMRVYAMAGIPLPLTNGNGKVLGLFCIKQLRDSSTSLIDTGAARKIEFTISLTAYGEDGATGVATSNSVTGAIDAAAQISAARASVARLKLLGMNTVGGLPMQYVAGTSPITSAAAVFGAQASYVGSSMSDIGTSMSRVTGNGSLDAYAVGSAQTDMLATAGKALAALAVITGLANNIRSGRVNGFTVGAIIGIASSTATPASTLAKVVNIGATAVRMTNSVNNIRSSTTGMTTGNFTPTKLQITTLVGQTRTAANDLSRLSNSLRSDDLVSPHSYASRVIGNYDARTTASSEQVYFN